MMYVFVLGLYPYTNFPEDQVRTSATGFTGIVASSAKICVEVSSTTEIM